MRFLNESLQTRQIVSSLSDASAKNEVVTSFDTENEQHKSNAIAGPSKALHTQISASNNSPQTSLCVPSRTPTPTNISLQSLDSDVFSQTPTFTKYFSSTENRVPTRTQTTKLKRLFIY